MEQATQRWVVILGVVVVICLVLVLSHAFLGVRVVPW
jgi:hypothetical protein